MGTSEEFGAELRRRRVAAGLTTTDFAARVRYSKGFVSKIENGRKAPSTQFARVADAVLQADGRLLVLHEGRSTPRADPPASPPPDQPFPEDVPAEMPPALDDTEAKHALSTFERVYDEVRELGQTLNPSVVASMLVPHIAALESLAGTMHEPLRNDALRLTAHLTDFTSWMTQEAGDDITARAWIDRSAALAEAVQDDDMIAHLHVRRANIAMYQQDAYGTIAAARQASTFARTPSRLSSCASREAQGHALAGDFRSFRICMDRAYELNALAENTRQAQRGPVAGPTRIRNPLKLAEGWSLYDLGMPAEAVEVLAPELSATQKTNGRAWAKIAARLALALASLREIDRACTLTEDILQVSVVAHSATIRSDLRQLARILNRWNSDPAVRELAPKLSAALAPNSGGHLPGVSPTDLGRRW